MNQPSAVAMWVLILGSGAAIAVAQQTVTLTSTADFEKGNNEGLISTAQDRLTRDRITAGAIGEWSSTSSIPSERDLASSVAYNGFVYVTGGTGSGWSGSLAYTNVFVAPVNGDGAVGPWSSTTPFSIGRRNHRSIAYNGYLYVMGGVDNYQQGVRDVQFSPMNPDGSVDAWAATTPLPPTNGLKSFSAVAHNGFLFVIGGFSYNQNVADVRVAPIHADGSLGEWSSTTPLPSPTGNHDSVAYNGFLYVIGGKDANPGVLSSVLVAPINADGSIGAWSATTALPSGRIYHRSVAYNGFVYCIGGGQLTGGPVSTVLVAPIHADGSVGAWSSSSAIPSARSGATSIAYKGFLYVIGGTLPNYGYLADVLVTPIDADSGNENQSPDRLRGIYSHVVDTQSDTPSRTITLNGQLSPGGVVRLQARVAPDATGGFGEETVIVSAPLGSPLEIPGSGRFVWFRLTLDDTATGDEAQATYVTEITISPGTPPSAGVVMDGSVIDIDTQESTTTIEAYWSGFTGAPGDGIASYEWAIGTAPGLTDVQEWTQVGPATSASNPSLSLGSGMKFVSVRATSAAGFMSPTATSDGVHVLPAPAEPGGGGSGGGGRGCGTTGAEAVLMFLALSAWRLKGKRRRQVQW